MHLTPLRSHIEHVRVHSTNQNLHIEGQVYLVSLVSSNLPWVVVKVAYIVLRVVCLFLGGVLCGVSIVAIFPSESSRKKGVC